MSIIFQYGSNMSLEHINSAKRLSGDAKPICIAKTSEPFELVFSVWSKGNECAAADLLPCKTGRSIYGVLYEIPDFLLLRETAIKVGRKALDAIEGEGQNYTRTMIDLTTNDGLKLEAITYLVKDRQPNLKTSSKYANFILSGLYEHNIPLEYCQYVISKLIENNANLEDLTSSWMAKFR